MIVSSTLNHKTIQNTRGLSLLETLSVVALLGILSAIAVPASFNITSSSRDTKLTHDVRSINSAVLAYLGSGGNLDGITNSGEVIDQLKRALSTEARQANAGFAGASLDYRVAYRTIDQVAYSPERVAVWNSTKQRFKIVKNSNTTGAIAEFVLDDTIDSDVQFNDISNERVTALQFNKKDGWVWDYTDPDQRERLGPTVVEVSLPELEVPTPEGPNIEVFETTSIDASVGANQANNAGFESPIDFSQATRVFGKPSEANAYYIDQDEVTGWQTNASDGLIEVWQSGFNGVEAYEGNNFVEFNATEVATLYQQVDTAGAQRVQIFFAHGQRSQSTEQLRLYVGNSAPADKNSAGQTPRLEDQGFELITQTRTNAVGGWETYALEYEITGNPDTLYFAFESFGEFQSQSVGNFLDQVSFRAVTNLEVTGLRVDLSSGNSTSNIINSGTVKLTGTKPGDDLSIDNIPNNIRYTISSNPNAEEITIHLSGTGFRWEYEAAFAKVLFNTTSEDQTPRTLLFSANDGVSETQPVPFEIAL